MNLFSRLFGLKEPDEAKVVQLGVGAARVLEEQPIQQALADMKYAAHMAFKAATPEDVEALVAARLRLQAAEQFEQQLEVYIQDGEIGRHNMEQAENARAA